MPRLALAALAPLLLASVPSPARAQTPQDSVAVLTAAVEGLLGAPPWKHPAGFASTVCLAPGRPVGPRPPATTEAIAAVGDRLARGAGRVGSGCHMTETAENASFGGWIRDDEGEPAVQVNLFAPDFATDVRARVEISHRRGGRWGGGRVCTVVRDSPTGPWRATTCEQVWVS